MTKFQEEKKQVFDTVNFDASRYEYILNTVHEKKRKNGSLRFVSVAIAFIVLIGAAYLLQQTRNSVQAFSLGSLEDTFVNVYDEDLASYEILHSKLTVLNDRDGIVVVQFDDEEFALAYASFFDKQWNFLNFQYLNIDEENYSRSSINENEHFIFSIYKQDDAPGKIVIGNDEVVLTSISNPYQFFIHPTKSQGMPVYYFENHKRYFVTKYKFVMKRDDLPLVQKKTGDIIDPFGASAMDGLYGTFTTLPLVIDTTAYREEQPQIGDVVAFKYGTETIYSRIIAPYNFYYDEKEVSISIEYGSILIDGQFYDNEPFYYNHYSGSTSIFDQSPKREYYVRENEYFVKSDNWQTNLSFEGVIPFKDIIGKVKGYSSEDVNFIWPAEVLSVYERFKESYDDKALQEVPLQEIALVQLYAQYNDDLETWYNLHAESSLTRTYKEWSAMINYAPLTQEQKNKLEFEASLISRAMINEETGLIHYFEDAAYAQNPIQLKKQFIFENDVWKAAFEKITTISN